MSDIDGAVATAPPFVADLEPDDDEAIEDLQLDDLDLGPDARVDQLEAAVKTLAAQHVAQHQQRVRRKVTAATGGAGLAALVPIGLQLLDALNLSAEVASTVAAAAGALGALLAGYLTPERDAPAQVLTP
jgi:hypothetical protein